eukprot:COSAG01_NODE_3964_length_5490_cov_36.725283_1_plen_274_part_10
MLGLSSHEPYFSILRENVSQKARPQPGLNLSAKEKSGEFDEKDDSIADVKQFEFLHIHILREYLEAEFKDGVSYAQGFDLERVIDDFVFLCFFAGNDFLPHLPSLDIREGGIDTLLKQYKNLMSSMGGYLTENGKVILGRTEMVALRLGQLEDAVFADRQDKNERQARNRQRRKRSEQAAAASIAQAGLATPLGQEGSASGGKSGAEALSMYKEKLKKVLYDKNEVEEVEDEVQLHTAGFKARYYMKKFHVDIEKEPDFPRQVVKAYVEGLVWV